MKAEQSAPALTYRPEIDGLRALAVVPVIFFHAGFAGFGGGYIGVDVFFVISGYLITLILAQDLAAGHFSLLSFYERRARRILPALVVVVLATWPLVWAVMLPFQRADYSITISAMAFFSSNLLFGTVLDYFNPAAGEWPFLHTWSLSVEEQFYLLFPLLLALVWRLGAGHVFLIVAALAVASLMQAQYGASADPARNFFSTGSRAFELMAGVLCGLAERRFGRWRSDALALVGLGLILGAVVWFTEATPMPSLWTLVPVLGAALIVLFARRGGRVAGALAIRPVVWLGLMSYSAYLWHLPLMAVLTLWSDGLATQWQMAGVVALTWALAWVSWRYVETPLRKRDGLLRKRRTVLLSAGVSLAALFGVGYAGWSLRGGEAAWLRAHPELAPTYRLMTTSRATANGARSFGPCLFNLETITPEGTARIEACAAKEGPAFVVLGDSHAIDVYLSLAEVAPPRFLLGLTESSCNPTLRSGQCVFDDFRALVAERPELFAQVLYVQAGHQLMLTRGGASVLGKDIVQLNVSAAPPVFHPDLAQIAKVADYLESLAKDVPVTWLAPRVEPHISMRTILGTGCAGPYKLRENQREAFEAVDKAIAVEITGRSAPQLHYGALALQPAFDTAQDVMTCDAAYWYDGDHWSDAGRARFGTRLVAAHLPGLEALVLRGK